MDRQIICVQIKEMCYMRWPLFLSLKCTFTKIWQKKENVEIEVPLPASSLFLMKNWDNSVIVGNNVIMALQDNGALTLQRENSRINTQGLITLIA